MGKLYLVPTPIGNLGDMSYRAVEVLRAVDLIAAEDTRQTRKLLDHYGIETPLVPYHQRNELVRMEEIFDRLGKGDVALVSDAGTPGISDPGFKLIREALERDYEVTPLPGATAMVPALIASGLPTDSFVFVGFLPKKSSGRRQLCEELKFQKRTLVAYESPHRLGDALADLFAVLGQRRVCVAREISKKFEEFWRGNLAEAVEVFGQRQVVGELVLVIEGDLEERLWSDDEIIERLDQIRRQGRSLSEAAKEVAKLSGRRKNYVYRLGLATKA
jgi:16S rRNA (cytidine1402-2'-O)-methyltransferase